MGSSLLDYLSGGGSPAHGYVGLPTLAAYNQRMVIVEFPNFTKAITALMPDDEHRQLQAALVENPALGERLQAGRAD